MTKSKLQPVLEDHRMILTPLKPEHFDELFNVANDPLIWEQHPNNDRYKKEVFHEYFEDAIKSGGAFVVIDKSSGKIIGCTRYYGYDADARSVSIGFTFLSRDRWGGEYNGSMKKLMIDHAFGFTDAIDFHIGAFNLRSQKALIKIGGKKISDPEAEANSKYTFRIRKEDWE